jgi:hypothetical protein
MTEEIPQIIAVVSVSPDGSMVLRKDVRDYLGMKESQKLSLDMQDEIVLSAEEGYGEEIPVIKRNRIRLPNMALDKLDIAEKSLVGIVQRRKAVAIKKFEVSEKKGQRARVVDRETTYRITRIAETNPMPEKLLPKLRSRYKDFKLRYDVESFLRRRRTFEAWKARKILGIAEPSDEDLRRELIKERLDKQKEDGSWEGEVIVTARNLIELAALGMRGDASDIRRAVDWLMRRPESPQHPGMFFAVDELVKEQEELMIDTRERETSRKKQDLLKLARKTNDLVGRPPCGLRMMWPTCLVLEALSKLGYERNERLQRARLTLMSDSWCEAYRLRKYRCGQGELAARELPAMEEIEAVERECMEQYRYGGISGLKELEKKYLASRAGAKMLRTAHSSAGEVDAYPLKMPGNLQGCELRITRALSHDSSGKMRRLGEAYLWRFAGRQHSTDGSFMQKGHEKYLEILAMYDHPVSKVVIMRSIPWIVNNQNRDGSWGAKSNKDSSTLAVITALRLIGLM